VQLLPGKKGECKQARRIEWAAKRHIQKGLTPAFQTVIGPREPILDVVPAEVWIKNNQRVALQDFLTRSQAFCSV